MVRQCLTKTKMLAWQISLESRWILILEYLFAFEKISKSTQDAGIKLHCKYIDRRYYDILSCLIYHSNLVVICIADGRFQPLVVVCQSRFIVDIGIKEKYRIQC